MSQPDPTQPAPATPPAPYQPVQLTYRHVADETTVPHMARVVGRCLLRSRRMIGTYVALLVVALGALAASFDDRALTVILIGYVLLVGFGLSWRIRRSTRRALSRTHFPGAEVWSGFGPTSFATRHAMGAGEIAYANVRAVNVIDDVVVLRLRTSKLLLALPGTLMPSHEVARVQRAIVETDQRLASRRA